MDEQITIYRYLARGNAVVQVFPFKDPHCGFASPALDYVQKALDLNELLIENPSSTYFARVTGDCMIGAFIADPSILILDRSKTIRNHDLFVGVLDQQFVVRRYHKDAKGVVTLKAENEKYPSTILSGKMELEVWAVVTHIIIAPSEVFTKMQIS